MIKSMTGFGRGEYTDDKRSISCEIRSVNHRYCEISVKMSRRYQFAEERIKALVKAAAPRGKIELSISVEELGCEATEVKLNLSAAKAYYRSLKAMQDGIPGLEGEITLELLAAMPDVLRADAAELDEEELLSGLLAATSAALEKYDAMKAAEGEKLLADIVERGRLIESTVCEVEEYAPETAKQYAAKLKTRISELLEGAAEIPEERILLEAAIFADKTNITEELVRLKSHCAQLRSICEGKEAAGKKLDFLVQEMNREANTIGSKANDIRITDKVLTLKAEIEKIREQVQNLE